MATSGVTCPDVLPALRGKSRQVGHKLKIRLFLPKLNFVSQTVFCICFVAYCITCHVLFVWDPMQDQLYHVDRAEYGLSNPFLLFLYGNEYYYYLHVKPSRKSYTNSGDFCEID